ncbi:MULTISPECIES: nitroreductase family protein [unclassified Streptomyces]|uniref:Acg family FMN-binding oxidoreductase n=1 Tax=unclassified Streptomyces TaxID=2593676 RepID=UPI002365FF86|nr:MULTISPECIES: nitroreductase family protein [unclassified Streptomyces]MDF3143644.1 nitroreductase family protein [Streptomyces sp. T21Q-yed]WDF44951.1 nitroreductase family protein [Streptomyces sp. T12]
MHNAQPWRFRYFKGTGTFELRADFDRAMPHSDPDTRALHLGCGAALLNLRVAVVHEGRHPETRLLPDPTDRALLASVQLTGPAGDESDLGALYPAIHQRHSSRYPFEETKIPDALREALSAAARDEGATLSFPTSWHLQDVLELVQEAEARNITDPGSAQDLAQWTQIDASSVNTADDGVPQYAFGPRKRGGRAPMRDFAGPRQVAGRDAADFEQNPQLALLSTAHDHPEDWLLAGQAMERVLLLATLRGLSSSFVTQPLEWTDLRWPLRDPVTGTGYQQLLLRLGYGPKGPSTPRRPVTEILDIQP